MTCRLLVLNFGIAKPAPIRRQGYFLAASLRLLLYRWLRFRLRVVSNKCIAVRKVATPLRELACHMGSHSVACHPAEVAFPPLPQPKLVLVVSLWC